MNSAMKLQPAAITRIDLKPWIASELRIDKNTPLSGVASAEIRVLLEERGVIVVREIHLDDAEQIAFRKTLGSSAGIR